MTDPRKRRCAIRNLAKISTGWRQRVRFVVEPNQNPEQVARDEIDRRLAASGWVVQRNRAIDHGAGKGIAIREYPTGVGPADYCLFTDKRAVGVVEAKPDDWGAKITTVETQSGAYASAELKWVKSQEPLKFIYEATGKITRFTDARDPHPRSREVFTFHRPETLLLWSQQSRSFRRVSTRCLTLMRLAFVTARLGRSRSWKSHSGTIALVPSSRWPRVPARHTRRSLRSTAC